MELQLRHSDFLSHPVPLLGGELIYEKPFLPIWKRSSIVGELRHDLLWNWAFRHYLPRFAVPRGHRVSIEVYVADTDGLNVTTPESCRHCQQHPKAHGRITFGSDEEVSDLPG